MIKRIEIMAIPVIGDGHGEWDWVSIVILAVVGVCSIWIPYVALN